MAKFLNSWVVTDKKNRLKSRTYVGEVESWNASAIVSPQASTESPDLRFHHLLTQHLSFTFLAIETSRKHDKIFHQN